MRLLQEVLRTLVKILEVTAKTRLTVSWTEEGKPIIDGQGLAVLIIAVGIVYMLLN
jgi:hypothetical protein